MAQVIPFPHNQEFPYDPITRRGHVYDSAVYLQRPGQDFLRPWIAIPGGRAFVWPIGVEGFTVTISPTVAKHKPLNGNVVHAEVTHKGEETIELSGTFPGDTAAVNFRALRDIVYQDTPEVGKLLYLPYVFPNVQLVIVGDTSFTHPDTDASNPDFAYSISLTRIGITKKGEPVLAQTAVQPGLEIARRRGGTGRSFIVDGKHNTLRSIALFKLNNSDRWVELYHKNEAYFKNRGVNMAKVPGYRLEIGTAISY